MMDTTTNICHLLIKHEKEAKDFYQKITSNSKLIIWLSIPCFVYLVLNIIVIVFGEYFKFDIFTVLLPFIFYIIPLFSISLIYSKVISSIKKDIGYEIEINGVNLAHIYTIFLFTIALYFFFVTIAELLGMDGITAIREYDWISAKMEIISLTLYVGFVVSLEDLFNKKDYSKVCIAFLKPFVKLGIPKKYIIGGLLVIIALAFAGVLVWAWFGMMIVVFGFLGMIGFIDRHRKTCLNKFGLQIQKITKESDVLIFQLGADYIVKKHIGEFLKESEIEITEEREDFIFTHKFDTIIVLNSIHKEDKFLYELEKIKAILKDSGTIIDPFVTNNKKRNFLASWFGIPNAYSNEFILDEYFQMLAEKYPVVRE